MSCKTTARVRSRVDRLTETAADVDVEVDAVVAIVHQVTVIQLDQGVEVVLLPVGVEHVAGHLQRGRRFISGCRGREGPTRCVSF